MAKFYRYIKWIVFSLFAVLLLSAVGLGIYSQTESFRHLVQQQLLDAINSEIRGTLSVERITGSIWGDITLYNVKLDYRDTEIAKIPNLRLSYALLPLLRGEFQIARADAKKPVVRMRQAADSSWDLLEALEPRQEDEETPSQLVVLLRALTIEGGELQLTTGGQGSRSYRATNMRIASTLTIKNSVVEFKADDVSAQLVVDGLPETLVNGKVAYTDKDQSPLLSLDNLILATAASRLSLTGNLSDFDHQKISAQLAITKIAAADMKRFVPAWPVEESLAGRVSLSGPLEALHVKGDLTAGPAQVAGDLRFDMVAPKPRFRGAVRFAGIDARRFLPQMRIGGILAGSTEWQDSGFAFEQLRGNGELAIRTAEAGGWSLGDVQAKTGLQNSVVSIVGSVKGEIGDAELRGQLSVAAANYESEFAVKNLNVKKIAAKGEPIAGNVNFKGSLKGTGFDPATMKSEVSLAMLPSSLGGVDVQRGVLAASLAAGRVRISHALLESNRSVLTVKGDLGIDPSQRGVLDYEFRSENLAPWLALLGREGKGGTHLKGRAEGSLADLTARGTLTGAGVEFGRHRVSSATVSYNLTRKKGDPGVGGTLAGQMTDLRAGIELKSLDANIDLRAAPVAAKFDARGEDTFGRKHQIAGNVEYSPLQVLAQLTQLRLTLPDGSWTMNQAAELTLRDGVLTVQKLMLRNGERSAGLAGRLALAGPQQFNINIERFPLEGFAAFLPKQPRMTGVIALTARVAGTAAAPMITTTAKLNQATIGGQSYAGLDASLAYGQGTVILQTTVRQDAKHALTAKGRLPLQLSWHDGFRWRVTGDLDFRARSEGLSLAFLNAYTAKTVSDLSGEVTLDVVARGSVMAPALSGSFRIDDGRLKATMLNVPVEGINIEGQFNPRSLMIKSFAARSGDGRLNGSGLLTLKDYKLGNFSLDLAARRWPAINTRRYQGMVGGNIKFEGTLQTPKLSGRIDITEASLRPDLAFLARSSTPVKRDETIVIVNRDGSERRDANGTKQENGLSDSQLFKKLALDLTVRIPRNVWIRHPEAVAELRGNVRATKLAGQELQLVGLAEIIRGWAGFQGRRFNFERGEIRFVGGGSIDPVLEILARHRLPQYTVDAVVTGTAEKPNLLLRSDPALDQADILALLLFGKPTRDLARGEQELLKQNALDVASGFAAANIGAAVAESIGLDELGFDLGDFDFSGGRVGYGRYLGRQTYVTVNQELAGEKGEEVSVEYQISREWKIKSSTTSKGTSEVDIIWHKRY